MQPFCSFPQCSRGEKRKGRLQQDSEQTLQAFAEARGGHLRCPARRTLQSVCIRLWEHAKDQRLRGERPKCACLDVRGVCRPSFVTRIVQRRTRACEPMPVRQDDGT